MVLSPHVCGITGQSNRKSVSCSLLTVGLLQCCVLCPISHVYSLILMPSGLTSTLCNFHRKVAFSQAEKKMGWNGGRLYPESLVFHLKVKSTHTYSFGKLISISFDYFSMGYGVWIICLYAHTYFILWHDKAVSPTVKNLLPSPYSPSSLFHTGLDPYRFPSTQVIRRDKTPWVVSMCQAFSMYFM